MNDLMMIHTTAQNKLALILLCCGLLSLGSILVLENKPSAHIHWCWTLQLVFKLTYSTMTSLTHVIFDLRRVKLN